MYIVHKKLGWKFFFALVGLLTLAIVSIDLAFTKNPLTHFRLNIGNFFVKNLETTGIHPGSIMRLLRTIATIPEKKISGEFPAKLGALHISIKFKYLNKIKEERDKAIQFGMLWGQKSYPAKIEYEGKTYRAALRLKGDLHDHWEYPDRWSFRVNLKDKKTILGMSRFSLHNPNSRVIADGMLFQSWAAAFGNLSPRYSFARVSVNGDAWGVMHMEEHVSNYFLELSRRKDAPIFRIGTDANWVMARLNTFNSVRTGEHGSNQIGMHDIPLYGGNRYAEDPEFIELFTYALHAYRRWAAGNMAIEDLIDVDSFSRLLFAANAWQNGHPILLRNLKFYLNPYTLKFEPVTMEQEGLMEEAGNDGSARVITASNTFLKALIQSAQFKERFEFNLAKVESGLPSIDKAYAEICRTFPLDCPKFNKETLLHNFRNIRELGVQFFLTVDDSTLPKAGTKTGKNSDLEHVSSHADVVFLSHVLAEYYATGRLELGNVLGEQVVVERVSLTCHQDEKCEPQVLIDQSFTLASGIGPVSLKRKSLAIPAGLKLNKDRRIEIVSRRGNEQRRAYVSLTYYDPAENPFLTQADLARTLLEHPFLERTGRDLIVKPGIWKVDAPLVIPQAMRLVISPGTTLAFVPDSYILSQGAIQARGTATAPVRMIADGKSWKGIYVTDAAEPSELKHVEVLDTKPFRVGMLRLTGGVTFYRSDIVISHSLFAGTSAEDALNIVHSNFTIINGSFIDAISDGIDSDFSNGRIENSLFVNIGGDGFDTSGSTVNGQGLTFIDIGDKALSIGEKSTVEISDIRVEKALTAVVSKDGSSFRVDGLDVADATLFAGMTYVKKPAYGSAALSVSNTSLPPESFFNQAGNSMNVNGTAVIGRELDVESLYRSGPMQRKERAPVQ